MVYCQAPCERVQEGSAPPSRPPGLQPSWVSHIDEPPTIDVTTNAKPLTYSYGIGDTPGDRLRHTY